MAPTPIRGSGTAKNIGNPLGQFLGTTSWMTAVIKYVFGKIVSFKDGLLSGYLFHKYLRHKSFIISSKAAKV